MTSLKEDQVQNVQPMLFSNINGKKLQLQFDAPEVSSDAGMLIIREVERHTNFIKNFAESFTDRLSLREESLFIILDSDKKAEFTFNKISEPVTLFCLNSGTISLWESILGSEMYFDFKKKFERIKLLIRLLL